MYTHTVTHAQNILLLLLKSGLHVLTRPVGEGEMEGGRQKHSSYAKAEERGVNLRRSYRVDVSVYWSEWTAKGRTYWSQSLAV